MKNVSLAATLVLSGLLTLPSRAPAEPPPGEGWVALFDGTDLSQWRILEQDTNHWKMVDGLIDCDALASRALWTKESFDDFVLHIQWRMKTAKELYGSETDADGKPIYNSPNSGILLRGTAQAEVNIWANPIGSGQIWAYHRGEQSKELTEAAREAYRPNPIADRPIGQWNTFLITLRGERLTVVLNEKTVIDDVRLAGISKRGPIALQQHGGLAPKTGRYRGASSTLQFRNVYIRPPGQQSDSRSPQLNAPTEKSNRTTFGVPFRLVSPRPQKPNIVLLLIDDLGFKDVGYMGTPYYETPNIDRLAGQGMVFTSAYANAPNCLPSRACLMTGQYTPRHGIYNIAGPGCTAPGYLRSMKRAKLKPIENSRGLPPGTVTIQQALREAGYATGFIGKWHHGQSESRSDFDYTASFGPSLKREDADSTREAIQKDPKFVGKLTYLAEQFIARNKTRPFYLLLSHHAVHIPVEARAETAEKYRAKPADGGRCQPDYAAMIEHTDESVGRILTALDEHQITDRTIVVFFSDNGGESRCTANAPLRGEKQLIYEGGIRVPMAVRWLGRIEPGSVCDVPVIGTDFFPTFLHLAGASPPEADALDGENLVPLFFGAKALGRDAIFWHIPSYWHKCMPCGAMRLGNYKLIEFFEDRRLELYDLEKDLGEQNNLVEAMPEKAKELYEVMLAWRRSVDAPIPAEPNPLYEPEEGQLQ